MNTLIGNVTDALKTLSSAEVQARIRELTAEEKALRALLRSIKARDRITGIKPVVRSGGNDV